VPSTQLWQSLQVDLHSPSWQVWQAELSQEDIQAPLSQVSQPGSHFDTHQPSLHISQLALLQEDSHKPFTQVSHLGLHFEWQSPFLQILQANYEEYEFFKERIRNYRKGGKGCQKEET
jgi:hypothetical protein